MCPFAPVDFRNEPQVSLVGRLCSQPACPPAFVDSSFARRRDRQANSSRISPVWQQPSARALFPRLPVTGQPAFAFASPLGFGCSARPARLSSQGQSRAKQRGPAQPSPAQARLGSPTQSAARARTSRRPALSSSLPPIAIFFFHPFTSSSLPPSSLAHLFPTTCLSFSVPL